MQQFRFAPVLLMLFYMTACGGSSQSANSAAGAVSGNWQMSLQKNNSKLKPNTLSGFLLEDAAGTVTGNVILTYVPCSGVGAASGAVTQPNISLTVSPNGTTLSLTGTVGSDLSSMSGDYTMLSTGCSGSQNLPSQTGTWKANLVKPFSGNIQGTFTSTTLGTAFPISGQVSQGPNTGGTYAALTGNLAITGSSCFSSASISGVISGTAVAINFSASNGTEIGQITGTSSLDGTSLSGSYKIVPQGTLPGTPCRGGDTGTVSLTL
jgi:hypothetical protein